VIRPGFDAVAIARCYAGAGAACLSVLTDAKYFQGSPAFLKDIRAAVELPLLRKDFVVDAYQLLEARAWGADAALLIVAALSPTELGDLLGETEALGLTALVEVHTAEETAIAVDAGARLIGINNRDLTVFETRLETTAELRPQIPADRLVVSESGIRTPRDVRWLRDQRVDAMLVGEALMRSPQLAQMTRSLVEAGQ
jgi:indole-3-glycerol phosphate synthase